MYVYARWWSVEVDKDDHNIGPAYMENLFSKIDQFYSTRCIKPAEQPSFNMVTYGCNSYVSQRSTMDNKGL